MRTKGTRLELEERCRLRRLMEMKLGISQIARRLERDPLTLHREIEREHCVEGYRPDSTQRRASAHKLRESLQVQGTGISC